MHSHHHHNHSHSHIDQGITWAFFLNLGFTVVEFICGVLFNSTAILADAVHDLGDCLAIALAMWFQKVSLKSPNQTYTYGYKRFSLLAAIINGMILLAGSAWVMLEAIPRLTAPEMPNAPGMVGLAIVGIAVNGFAAYKVSKGGGMSNKMVNWHLMEDVLGWVAILIVGIILSFVQLPILDPILSIGFGLFIAVNVVKLLWQTLKVIFQAAPSNIVLDELVNAITDMETVSSVHHIHFWSLDGENHVFTAHVTLSEALSASEQAILKREIADTLKQYQFLHTTIELELPGEVCRDQSTAS